MQGESDDQGSRVHDRLGKPGHAPDDPAGVERAQQGEPARHRQGQALHPEAAALRHAQRAEPAAEDIRERGARVLAIRGADIILLPTNWPPGGEYMAQFSINSRAMENGVYFAAVNRIGTENGFRFIGKSRICSPVGATMTCIDNDSPGIIRADIDPVAARTKRIVRVPGKHIIDRMADRRPEMYGAICEPHDLKRPGRDEQVSD